MKKILLIIAIVVASFTVFYLKKARHAPTFTASDTIIVGTSADFKPFSFKEGDEIVGFDIDLINEIGKRLNKKIELKDMPFEILLPQIQLGSIQVVAAGMSSTPERAKRAIFSKPYITGTPLVAVTLAKNGPIKNFDELKTKQIIVNQGYVADTELSKIAGMNLTRLNSVVDALMSLDAGRGDAFVTALSSIKPALDARGHGSYALFVLENTEENTALVISKEYPELAQHIDTTLDAMVADGTLNALKQKWFPGPAPEEPSEAQVLHD